MPLRLADIQKAFAHPTTLSLFETMDYQSRCQVFRRTTQPNILHRMGVIIKCRSGWQRYKKHLHIPITLSLFEPMDCYQSPSSSSPGCSMDVLVPDDFKKGSRSFRFDPRISKLTQLLVVRLRVVPK